MFIQVDCVDCKSKTFLCFFLAPQFLTISDSFIPKGLSSADLVKFEQLDINKLLKLKREI